MFQSARWKAGGKDNASSGQMESNPQPHVLQASALATRLRRLMYDVVV